MNKKLSVLYAGLVLLGALARILPHPPNFTPTGAMAFFAGNKIKNRLLGILIPLGILALSDIVRGWHSTLLFVYGSFVITWALGRFLGSSAMGRSMGLAASSLIFFALSNLGVWLTTSLYPHTMSGLALCYGAALPFLTNELAANVLFGGAFYAVAGAVERREA
ncbi:MAG: hypothetical protein HY547_08490, partial [Elusimicrobia bacterium]|nr:hypothetical protein [Elusimicrobiota bacterium]